MKMIIDEIGLASCESILGQSPLLSVCGNGVSCGLDGIKLLFQHGASVHDRDAFGNTCLHHWLGNSVRGLVINNASNLRNGLIYLIEQGADVFAKNASGESVSHYAHRRLWKWDSAAFENKFREEFWDCALASCGYNLSDFRRRRRPAVYSRPCRSTRRHFEDLWAGSEHLRPDYDNEKSAIYFSDPDEVGEDSDGDSELEQLDDSDWGDPEDGGVRLASDNGSHS